MSKKGQKFNNYTKETKEEILQKYLMEHISAGYLSKIYGLSENTIRMWARKAKQGPDVLVDTQETRRGRPKKNPDEIDYKEHYEIVKNSKTS